MSMVSVPWSLQTYQHRSPNVSAVRTLNLYPEVVNNGAEEQIILIGCPGTERFGTIPNTGATCRGIHTTATGRLFAVYGGVVYEFGDNGSVLRSFLISGLPTRVRMADNGAHLVIVDRVTMYCIDLNANALVPVQIDSDLTNPTGIIYLGGFFYAIDDTNRVYFSDINQGPKLWNANGFFTAERSADPVIAIASASGNVWLFGTRSYEVWTESGDVDLPLRRILGSTADIGCASAYSVQVIGDSCFWLGSSAVGTGQVYMTQGYQAQAVTNPAISYLITKNGLSLRDAYSLSYQQEGHVFYVLSLVTADKTIVYDASNGMWHERASRDPLTNQLRRWDVTDATFAFGRVICGNLRGEDPALLTLSLDRYLEYDGRLIVRIHQSPIYNAKGTPLFHSAFEVEMETGVGLQIGQGEDPVAMLEFSDDCHIWYGELRASIGKIGNYSAGVRWHRLGGRARERVYRVTISDPIKVVMRGGRLLAREGIGQ